MSRGERNTAWIAIAMAWCAGFVDAVGYLLLEHVYTSHMTGNTASLGERLVAGQWSTAGRYGGTILFFVAGMLAGSVLRRVERSLRICSSLAAVLELEIVLLGACMALWQWSLAPAALLVFLLAAAMGMQTITVTRVRSLRVYTTYVTGNLSKFVESATEYIVWLWSRIHGRFRSRLGKALAVTPRRTAFRRAAVTGGLWAGFFAGAVAGAGSEMKWAALSLAAPMALLVGALVIDLRSPVSLGDTGVEELPQPPR